VKNVIKLQRSTGMRTKICWLATALLAALALVVGGSEAQQPQGGKKGGFPDKFGKKGGFPDKFGKKGEPGITVEQLAARILAFDKSKDGKVTQDELPERMQHLIALGDVNKDGALDTDEVGKLSTALEAVAGLAGPGFPGGKGDFGGKGKGPGGKGKKGGFGPGGDFPPGPKGIDRILATLNLSVESRDKAEAIVKAHHENVRRVMDLAQSDLLLKMKEVLSEQEFTSFKEALDSLPVPPPFGAPRPPELERRLDQLQRELEELRRKIAK
jgi:hypothetical protein